MAKAPYHIADKQVIAHTPTLRVTLMTLDPGQQIPWHTHTQVTDTAFCLAGHAELTRKDPDETLVLTAGLWRETPPGTPHRLRCLGPEACQVLLVQGVGEYDFAGL